VSDIDTPQRRSSDSNPNPSNGDIVKLLLEMQRQLDTVIRKQEEHSTAFVTNDLGKPDLEGHRLYHFRSIKNAEQMDSYKAGMTKTIIDWAMKGALMFLVAGIISVASIKLGIQK